MNNMQPEKQPSKSKLVFSYLRTITPGREFDCGEIREALKMDGHKIGGGALSGALWRLEHDKNCIVKVDSDKWRTLPQLYSINGDKVFIRPYSRRKSHHKAKPVVVKSNNTESSVTKILAHVVGVQKCMQGLLDELDRLQKHVKRDDLSAYTAQQLLRELAKRDIGA